MLPGLPAGFAAPKVKLVWVAAGLTQLKAGLLLADGADCAVEASLNSVPLAAPADMGEIDIALSDSVDASGFVWICSSTLLSQEAHKLPRLKWLCVDLQQHASQSRSTRSSLTRA